MHVEQLVRMVCPQITCDRGRLTVPDVFGDLVLVRCHICNGNGTIFATLIDPEKEDEPRSK